MGPRGLNISGLSELTEASDSLAELAPSPRRLGFGLSIPPSPAWQNFEPTRPSPSPSRPRRNPSLEAMSRPKSPLGKRFEPTPVHGIHSRNLSLFFPQPGGGPPFTTTTVSRSPEEVHEAVMPEPKEAFGGTGDWKFGSSNGHAHIDHGLETPDQAKRSKRRGHHVRPSSPPSGES